MHTRKDLGFNVGLNSAQSDAIILPSFRAPAELGHLRAEQQNSPFHPSNTFVKDNALDLFEKAALC